MEMKNFNIEENLFYKIYTEIKDNGYICSTHRVFMRNIEKYFNFLCNKYGLKTINIAIQGNYFPDSCDGDYYIIFNEKIIKYDQAQKLLKKAVEDEIFFDFNK